MNRQEYKAFAVNKYSSESKRIDAANIYNDSSSMWIAEHEAGWQANYFAELWVPFSRRRFEHFWDWCDESLSIRPICFTPSIWGFATEEDITLFLLRWA